MRRPIGFLAVALTAVILGSSACNDNNTINTPTNPTTPTTTTETFTGTINPNGASIQQFTTEAAGTVIATLTSVTPDSSTRVGLSMGTWNGLACSIQIDNASAQQGVSITGTASALGTFCVRMYDMGSLTGNVTYQVTVTHP